MTDKFAPPRQLWDAKQCARLLGFRRVDAFLYRVNKGEFPAPHHYEGGKAWWDAQQVRDVLARQRSGVDEA